MLIECLYKTGIWCHQWDKFIDSDETDVTNATDMQEEAAGILPFCVINI